MTSGLAFLAGDSSLTKGERAARCLRDFLSSNKWGCVVRETTPRIARPSTVA